MTTSTLERDPENALFLLFGLLGDVLTRTPFIREFKRRFPRCKVTCVVDPIGGEVLENAPNIDELIIIPRSKRKKLFYVFGKAKLFLILISGKYDVFVDLYNNPSTRVFARVARSRMKIALGKTPHISVGVKEVIAELPFKNPHHIANPALEVMRYFWSEETNLDPEPAVDRAAKSMPLEEKEYLDELILKFPNFFVISRGAGHDPKCISVAVANAICQHANQTRDMTPFIVCNPGQESLQAELCQALESFNIASVALCPLKLSSLVYVFQKARFLAVPDSGLLHLGVAARCPILAIFTVTPPELVKADSRAFAYVDFRDVGARGETAGELGFSKVGAEGSCIASKITPELEDLLLWSDFSNSAPKQHTAAFQV